MATKLTPLHDRIVVRRIVLCPGGYFSLAGDHAGGAVSGRRPDRHAVADHCRANH